jgi:signal transduction histidine kinase
MAAQEPGERLGEKIARLRANFLERLPDRLSSAEELLRVMESDPYSDHAAGELRLLLHNIKGASATFRLNEVLAPANAAEALLAPLVSDRGQWVSRIAGEIRGHLASIAQTVHPLAEAPEPEQTEGPPLLDQERDGKDGSTPAAGKRVFLCDDDLTLAERLKLQIASFGYEVSVFSSPGSLWEAVKASPPHALIMDAIFAEGRDAGFGCVAELRRVGLSFPVLFLSSRDDFAARLQAVKAGGAAYFTKPVAVAKLVQRLDALTADDPPEAFRVLVVDDEPLVAQYHALILEKAGMVVRTATRPHIVLDILQEFRPDLLLIDIHMPGCSGRELAQVIRQIPTFVSLPIIFLSTEQDAYEQTSALRAGGDIFLSKPIEPDQLISSVEIRAERMRGLRLLMEELLAASEQAESATRAKTAFLAMMSHEIRTPMNGVTTMAELLARTPMSMEQRDMLSVIHRSAETLLVIINDILDLSKIEAGKLEIEAVHMQLSEVVEGTAEMIAGRAEEKGLEVVVDVGREVPESLIGDPARLRQVLLNLAGNAVKFTDKGSVVLRVRRLGEAQAGKVVLRFEVVDTGIGLSKEQTGRLFTAFEQADSGVSRRYGGTGLGLAISRQLCSLMGGSIGVCSTLGHGSTFWVELPLGLAPGAPSEVVPPIADLRLVVVGMSGAAGTALNEMVRRAGMEEPVFADATDRQLAAVCRQEAGHPVVVLVQASPNDGMVLAARLAEACTEPPLLLVAPKADLATLTEEGRRTFSGAVPMPLRRRRLWSALAAAVKPTASLAMERNAEPYLAAWVAPEVEEARAAGTLILVAEDNPINQLVTGALLSRLGYAFEMAANGDEALVRYHRGGHGLLLTDFHMPGISGFELASVIRRGEMGTANHLPIVALTADVSADTESLCRGAGMDTYLVKPISGTALAETLARLLPQAAALRRPARRESHTWSN